MSAFSTTFRLIGDDSDLRGAFRRSASEAGSAFGRIGNDIKAQTKGVRDLKEGVQGTFGVLSGALSGFGFGALASQVSGMYAEIEAKGKAIREQVERENASRQQIINSIRDARDQLRGMANDGGPLAARLNQIAELARKAMADIGKLTAAPAALPQESFLASLVPSFGNIGASVADLDKARGEMLASTAKGRLLESNRLAKEINDGRAAAEAAARKQAADDADRLIVEAQIADLRARGEVTAADRMAEEQRFQRAKLEAQQVLLGGDEERYSRLMAWELELHRSTMTRIDTEHAERVRLADDAARRQVEAMAAASLRKEQDEKKRLAAFEKSLNREAAPVQFSGFMAGAISGLSQRVGLGTAVDRADQRAAKAETQRAETIRAINALREDVKRNAVGGPARFA